MHVHQHLAIGYLYLVLALALCLLMICLDSELPAAVMLTADALSFDNVVAALHGLVFTFTPKARALLRVSVGLVQKRVCLLWV